ncbi:MAG: hypothetical protein HOE19_04060 [Candidatus Komeilibacteria bacterium]|nr:hypothetical protein [Candidatus Komeilibacteria bacterium]MBT4447848.1 hypothetical protein [Candidatus Komeilibacteria bacterium]
MLLVATVSICGAQVPEGGLYRLADGTHEYIVDDADDVGLWQVAFGQKSLWAELVKVNPQLVDPNLIMPGDKLIIPEALVRLFEFRRAPLDTTSEETHLNGTEADTEATVVSIESEDKKSWNLPWWAWIFIACLVGLIARWWGSTGENQKLSEARRQEHQEEAKREKQREHADPYHGPPVVPGGLPTPELAARHFAGEYQNRRGATTVDESAQQPERVTIDRIVPVEIRGQWCVADANSKEPVEKNIPDWEPAWQCFLSDDSWSVTLMMCGNDVWMGTRTTPMENGEIQPRQDMEAIEMNQQVWPIVTNEEPDELELPDELNNLREVRFKSNRQVVVLFHGDREQENWEIPAALSELVTLSLSEGQLIATTIDGTQRVLGVITDQPEADLQASLDNEAESLMGPTDPEAEILAADEQDGTTRRYQDHSSPPQGGQAADQPGEDQPEA